MISLAAVRRAIAVVAHPDDECLWLGGLLLATRPAIQWTVLCCSVPARDPIRAEKFGAACAALGARPVLRWRPEEAAHRPLPDLSDLARYDLASYDLVLTHGAAGEYGHLHHRQLHAWIERTYADRLATSAYRLGGPPTGAHLVALTDAQWAGKLAAIRCYDHHTMFRGERMTKADALLLNYGKRFDLRHEPYDGICA